MTIKEVEELSNMTRANIRFYEKEGLITPQRDPNGYRNYTEQDVDILKRIRLLRTVHLGLEEIRSLSEKESELTDVLLIHLRTLKKEQTDLEQSRVICEQLCKDQAAYESFDAEHYFNLLEKAPSEIPAELEADSLPKVRAPWKRYFARLIDETIYLIFWHMILSLGFHMNIRQTGLAFVVIGTIMQSVLLLLVEPVMLSRFGTTPGKFLFGFRVSAESGARLTWREAYDRTGIVLKRGLGFYIPVYGLIREYSSYRDCKKGEILEWEEDNILTLDERHMRWKVIAAVLVLSVLDVLNYFVWQAGALPQNRGNITAAQYAENFNHLQEFYQIDHQMNHPEFLPPYNDSMKRLNQYGDWEKMDGKWYVVDTGVDYPDLPRIQFTEKDGVLTEISLSSEYKDEKMEIPVYGDLMALASLSYICAQDDYHLLLSPPSRLYNRVKEYGDQCSDFMINEAGVKVQASFDFSGYEIRQAQYGSSDVLVPVYGEDVYFHVDFRIWQE